MDRTELIKKFAEKLEFRIGRTSHNQALLNDLDDLLKREGFSFWVITDSAKDYLPVQGTDVWAVHRKRKKVSRITWSEGDERDFSAWRRFETPSYPEDSLDTVQLKELPEWKFGSR